MVNFTETPMPTTQTRPASSRLNSFARAAVFAEFRPRDAHALDQANFVDRLPDQVGGVGTHALVSLRRHSKK